MLRPRAAMHVRTRGDCPLACSRLPSISLEPLGGGRVDLVGFAGRGKAEVNAKATSRKRQGGGKYLGRLGDVLLSFSLQLLLLHSRQQEASDVSGSGFANIERDGTGDGSVERSPGAPGEKLPGPEHASRGGNCWPGGSQRVLVGARGRGCGERTSSWFLTIESCTSFSRFTEKSSCAPAVNTSDKGQELSHLNTRVCVAWQPCTFALSHSLGCRRLQLHGAPPRRTLHVCVLEVCWFDWLVG